MLKKKYYDEHEQQYSNEYWKGNVCHAFYIQSVVAIFSNGFYSKLKFIYLCVHALCLYQQLQIPFVNELIKIKPHERSEKFKLLSRHKTKSSTILCVSQCLCVNMIITNRILLHFIKFYKICNVPRRYEDEQLFNKIGLLRILVYSLVKKCFSPLLLL